MSQADPQTIVEWLTGLPIPWLTATNGANDLRSYGSVLDGLASQARDAVKARLPDYAAADSLASIGSDRGLVRGPAETDANYAIRLKTAWDDWARAGTFLELLVQLHWAGFENAVIAQQNGLVFSLSASPTAGVDPTSLLTVSQPTTLNSLDSETSSTQPTVPAGSTWWTIDQSTEFGSRFVVLFKGAATWLQTFGVATFSSASSASLTWNKPLEAGVTYSYLVGAPVITDGSGGVAVWLSATSTTGATVSASDSVTGSVSVIAYPSGGNPYVNLSGTGLGVLQSVIRRWRPARATCAGVYALQQGKYFGWPVRTFGSGETFAGSAVVTISGTWS